MQTAVASAISNDPLCALVGSVAAWQIVRLVRLGQGARNIDRISLGVTLGVGIWTKLFLLVEFPVVLGTYVLLYRAGVYSWPRALRQAALVLGVALLIGAPWLIRNTMLYGDPLAMRATQVNVTAMDPVGPNSPGGPQAYWLKVGRVVFESYWGRFDSMVLGLPDKVYGVLSICVIASLLGVLKHLREQSGETPDATVLSAMGLIVGFTALAFIKLNAVNYQAQGRFLFAALVPLALFFGLGISAFVAPAWRGKTLAIAGALMLAFDTYCVAFVRSYFIGS